MVNGRTADRFNIPPSDLDNVDYEEHSMCFGERGDYNDFTLQWV